MRAETVKRFRRPVRDPNAGCTRLSPRCADAREYTRELRECCRGHLRALMRQVVPILNDLRVDWWADYGTLLGAVRNPMTIWADYPWLPQEGRALGPIEPGIVPHDKDCDLGVTWDAWPRVRQQLRALGGIGYNVLAMEHRRSIKVRLSLRNHTNIDLFFWRERKDGKMCRDKYARVDHYKGREFARDLLFPLSTVTWEGIILPAPRDPAAFLEMRYGRNWRTPVAANNDGVKR